MPAKLPRAASREGAVLQAGHPLNLSPNFTLDELTHSELATRRGLDNRPSPDAFENLKRTASGLEQVREFLQVPLLVTSGYRSPAVNRAVGGSAISAHCDGNAADFMAPAYGTPREVGVALRASGIKFDQLIFEGRWVHISFAPQMRQQVLTAHFNGGPATYTEGIA